MTKEANHYGPHSDEPGYITINGRSYVAKLKVSRVSRKSEIVRNAAGEILYALPGTDKTATERELRDLETET